MKSPAPQQLLLMRAFGERLTHPLWLRQTAPPSAGSYPPAAHIVRTFHEKECWWCMIPSSEGKFGEAKRGWVNASIVISATTAFGDASIRRAANTKPGYPPRLASPNCPSDGGELSSSRTYRIPFHEKECWWCMIPSSEGKFGEAKRGWVNASIVISATTAFGDASIRRAANTKPGYPPRLASPNCPSDGGELSSSLTYRIPFHEKECWWCMIPSSEGKFGEAKRGWVNASIVISATTAFGDARIRRAANTKPGYPPRLASPNCPSDGGELSSSLTYRIPFHEKACWWCMIPSSEGKFGEAKRGWVNASIVISTKTGFDHARIRRPDNTKPSDLSDVSALYSENNRNSKGQCLQSGSLQFRIYPA